MRSVSPVLVLLGASGRLGCAVQPLAVAAGFHVVAVARTPPAQPKSGSSTQWIGADLTVVRDRARVAAVTNRTASSGPIYVVDVVLDRRGVDAMHRSIRGATEGVLQLRTEFRAAGQETTLIAASTTAVLAPGLYQTPYGLAKRRQVVTYARSGVAGAALLLPNSARERAPHRNLNRPGPSGRPLKHWSAPCRPHRTTASQCACPPSMPTTGAATWLSTAAYSWPISRVLCSTATPCSPIERQPGAG